MRFGVLAATTLIFAFCVSARADERPLTNAETRRLLIDGEVLDAETNLPIDSFRVIPGVRYNRAPGTRSNLAVWQPHMIRQMSSGIFQWPRTRGYDEMRFRIEAEGYRAATTTWLGKGGPHLRMKVHMRPDTGIEGIVVTPDGSLAKSAVIAIGLPNRSIRLDGCNIVGHNDAPLQRLSDQWRKPLTVQADDEAVFVLPYESDPSAMLCVVHEDGYLEEPFLEWASQIEEATDPVVIHLEPWAKVKGRVWWKDRPGQGKSVSITINRSEPYPGIVESNVSVKTDQEGNFLFPYVPPGSLRVGHVVAMRDPQTGALKDTSLRYPSNQLFLKPGEMTIVEFGGEGVDVIGRLTGLDSYEGVTLSICPPAPDVWRVQRFGGNNIANDQQKSYAALRKTNYAPLYFRDSITVANDGSFRIKDVMTGQYNVWIRGASGSTRFNMTDAEQNPLNIGEIKVQPPPVVPNLPVLPDRGQFN
jgi:hypothetical protein